MAECKTPQPSGRLRLTRLPRRRGRGEIGRS
jgi:hypothetical protein